MATRRTCRTLRNACCALILGASAADSAYAQLRVVSLNSANSDSTAAGPRAGMDLIFQAIATSVSDDPLMPGHTGIAKPIDVLAIQESHGWATTGLAYASLLNSLVPGANYQVAKQDGGSTGSGTQSLVYNANLLQLISTSAVGTPSTSGQPRQTTRFQLRPVGYGPDADVWVYNAHFKSDSDSTSQSRRFTEASAIRASADALPAGANVIYLGDFNVYRSTESAYQALLAPGNAQALDPINTPGSWTASQTYKAIHTQSPFNPATAAALGTGFNGTTGGMDDRFDFQLVTANLLDNRGLSYIPNSYQAFGNNGSMAWGSGNNAVNQGGNTAQPQNVLDAMASILDHLPVVADYQLPARIGLTVADLPPRVIAGTPHAATVSVRNAAPVQYAIGADTLDYQFSTTGDLATTPATVTGKPALAPADDYTVTLDTTTLGTHYGTIHLASASQQVGGAGDYVIAYTAVDHSNASFSPTADVDAHAIDFGYVPLALGQRTMPFAVANLPAPSGYTAELTVTGVTDDSPQFGHDLATFTNVPAGSQHTHAATFTPTAAGAQSTTFTLHTADEAIPGATANATPLSLQLTGRAIDSATFPDDGFLRLQSGETYPTGPFSIAAGVTLTKTGPGTLHVTGPQANGANSTLIVTEGTAILSTDAGPHLSLSAANPGTTVHLASAQHLVTLTIDPGATVTLAADPLTLSSTPASTIRQYLLSDLLIPSLPTDAHALGYVLADSSVVVRRTLTGDANLDGLLNQDDYALLDKGFATGGAFWWEGDFNYDGQVTQLDYLAIDHARFSQVQGFSPGLLSLRESQFGPAYVAALMLSIPEPAAAVPLAAVTAGLIMRRRHRPHETRTQRFGTTELQ